MKERNGNHDLHVLLKRCPHLIFDISKAAIVTAFKSPLFVVYKSFMQNAQNNGGACDNDQFQRKKNLEETTEINSNTMHVFELRIFFQLQLWCWLNSNSFRLKNKAKISSALHTMLKMCRSLIFSISFSLSLSLLFLFFQLVCMCNVKTNEKEAGRMKFTQK